MKDLVILTADKNARFALEGALQRHKSLNIRPIECEFQVHTGRDGGARTTGPQLLAIERRQFSHALLVLDFEGCGAEVKGAISIEDELNDRLKPLWGDHAKAIVVEPEVDVWMWGADNAIREVIGWSFPGPLRDWLANKEFGFQENGKPVRPKEAFDAALRAAKQPRSSALYKKIAAKLSLSRCKDPAFLRLRQYLSAWFPSEK